MELLQLMTLLMKSILLAPTSRKQTTFYGLSSLEAQEADSVKKGILSKEEEIGEIEKLLSMTSSKECFDLD
jgi:hypothetical protein